jgi:hypothetical protein
MALWTTTTLEAAQVHSARRRSVLSVLASGTLSKLLLPTMAYLFEYQASHSGGLSHGNDAYHCEHPSQQRVWAMATLYSTAEGTLLFLQWQLPRGNEEVSIQEGLVKNSTTCLYYAGCGGACWVVFL